MSPGKMGGAGIPGFSCMLHPQARLSLSKTFLTGGGAHPHLLFLPRQYSQVLGISGRGKLKFQNLPNFLYFIPYPDHSARDPQPLPCERSKKCL